MACGRKKKNSCYIAFSLQHSKRFHSFDVLTDKHERGTNDNGFNNADRSFDSSECSNYTNITHTNSYQNNEWVKTRIYQIVQEFNHNSLILKTYHIRIIQNWKKSFTSNKNFKNEKWFQYRKTKYINNARKWPTPKSTSAMLFSKSK